MKNVKLLSVCVATVTAISLSAVGIIAATPEENVVIEPLGGQVETGEEMSVKEVAAKAMPAMVSITNTSVETVRDYFGGNYNLFPGFFDDFFGYGEYGFGGNHGFGKGGRNYSDVNRETVSAGSGVIVGETDTDILIATNAHVVDDATVLSVSFIDETTVEAELMDADEKEDVAMIKVPKSSLSEETLSKISVIPIGSSDDIVLGEDVVVIGNALGYGQSVSSGVISALNRSITALDEFTYELEEMKGLIQTDAAINAGNSGGAMLNMKGELIGINIAKANSSYADNIGFAIPINVAEPILSDIANGTFEEKSETEEPQSDIEEGDGNAYLGVYIATVDEEMTNEYGITGAYVQEVEKDSVAEKYGIRAGDVITAINGEKMTSADDVKNMVSHFSDGDTIELTTAVYALDLGENKGTYNERTVNITFGEKTEDDTI